ncbi:MULTISPECIES: class I SAM-dependent methyltransferase [Micromonospora]|uniref:class I SAM-dependent methyltransferase n=1 Tax=Micromonospora TaxID=1873 RepID=UPI0003EEDB8D|nr:MULTISPECIES: class I SAM-dependent methyltransferase [unclassified Micromonospora]EWM66767.1 methyltransferase [Micromonospora sp. M42]MCK1805931.1 class I SAM-dependent methyltransferase [Micromonospora sp. R42106]MCK1830473.1 class I SAM-dependent methyltransferase [Micromonospora sp. R42003]MCK1842372.1 class I SAM-dependent methyltransferase [Micromonospora sp. R42004]MCM1018766.1 class I SAM-dependent methyltransferase [Micromonospora sp. XM-20-01]
MTGDATASARATSQYATTTGNLTARIALHAYGTNPQSWFAWLGERLPLARDVLEVGAGTGELWHRIGPRGRLALTDFSPAMCARLREVPGARVQRCDATRLPFRDGAVDAVIANHMLYHLDDPDAALREFARVLRPGGRLAVAVNGRDHLAELDALGPAMGRPDLAVGLHQNDVTAETAPARVAAHFTDVTVERYPDELVVPAAEPILAYIVSMIGPLTVAEESAARAAIEARIDAEGAFRVRKHTVLISATRGSR